MNDIDLLIEESKKYEDILCEYCFLALRDKLTEPEAERMAEILNEANSDPLLSFWLDESEHLVAHLLGLIDEQFINQQQRYLCQSINNIWFNLIFNDLEKLSKMRESCFHGQEVSEDYLDTACASSTKESIVHHQKNSK